MRRGKYGGGGKEGEGGRRKESRQVRWKSNQTKIKVLEQKFRCLASTNKGKRSLWVHEPGQNIDFGFPHPYRHTHIHTNFKMIKENLKKNTTHFTY